MQHFSVCFFLDAPTFMFTPSLSCLNLFSFFPSPVLARTEGTVTWLKDGDEVDESLVENVDENSSKFIIKRAAMTDAGKYTCQFEFDSGHTDETEIQLYMYGM